VFGNVVAVVFSRCLFTQKCIKIIFFIFKKLFLTSKHQNDQKTQKKIILKSIKK